MLTRLLAHPCAASSSLLELSITLLPDLFVTSLESGLRGDIADGAVQSLVVVHLDEVADYAASIVEVERRARADGFGLQRAVPAFELAVRLRVNV